MIEIVIKIPDEEYNNICLMHKDTIANVYDWIANGIQLPKGHGRIIDESKITQTEWEMIEEEIESHLHDTIIHRYRIFKGSNAPTIIKADKAESEE